jgi:ribosomal protein S12 methylthiotransferase accessory factor
MPVPGIDLHSAHDPTIPLQTAAITAETGYQIVAFDTTMEQHIPSVWAMAVNPDDADSQPKTISAAGSNVTLEGAILKALSELGPILSDFIRRFPSEADRARQMASDSSLVKTMYDHSTLYGEPQVFNRLDFLTNSTGLRSLSDMPSPDEDTFRNTDLRDDLLGMLHRFVDAGMDVIVINQTTPEHQAGGFSCVKVLVPGAIPMTFGYHNRRIDGLPRLYHVPHLLGYQAQPLRHGNLNPHPHPFP